MTKWWVAQDSFVGETPEGAWVAVAKGQAIQEGDPQRGHLVALDRDGADAAAKAGVPRSALFAPMEFTGDEEEEKPAAKTVTAKAAPKGSAKAAG